MTTETHDHETDCLMCAVRALTEGDPAATWGQTDLEPGATISGVVLRAGEKVVMFSKVPYVDLWMGGTGRVRVMPFGASFRHALTGSAAQIGDRLTVRFEGTHDLPAAGSRAATTYKAFSVTVQRGH
jgi:hypothetical protein